MTVGRTRLWESVVSHVETELGAGRLPLGSRLPAERALAEQLGVSRASVREGIRVLEAMGVIRTAVGSGPDAGAVVVDDTAAGITSALRLHLAARTLPVGDLVGVRSVLEAAAVRQAAARQDATALAEAERLLTAMDDRNLPADRFHALDTEFHLALARAAGNVVVTAMMTALRESITGYVLAAVPKLPDWPATARRLRRQHRAVLTAVTAGDGDRAARLIAAHVEGFHREAAHVGQG